MANILAKDDTLQELVDKIDTQNSILANMIGNSLLDTPDWKSIQKVVQNGYAQKVFNIGDQLVVKYTNPADTSKVYDMPFDVVHFGDIETQDGQTKPAMFLQSHYATLQGIMFSGYQAFYYCKEKLSAGTYNIKWGNNWGTYIKSGDSWQFTLTKDVAAGGILTGFYNGPDNNNANLKVYSWETTSATTPLETVSISSGSGGTNLGTIYNNKKTETLGSMQDICYGYNRWSKSAIRQWLNADGDNWWTPQHNFDHRPDQYSQKGFMTGLEEDFKNIIKPIKVQTSANTLIDSGVTDVTYDKFFLPSLEQLYVSPQIKGIEGDYWEYWKERVGVTSPTGQYTTQKERITYALENHNSAQYVRLRSAYRGDSSNTWRVHSSGVVASNVAFWSFRCAPACAIY